MDKIIAWWSAGITSAVACKIAIEEFGVDNVVPIYFHIDTAHADNERFLQECENWYGTSIRIERGKYLDQFDVIERERYINGPSGARCTTELKKRLRQKIESEEDYDAQVFGFEYSKKEINRALRFKEQYPSAKPLFPLIERKLTKANCLFLLEKAGIKRPVMYQLGYGNNNCIGCVKGGAGYWNKIRVDFPDVFNRMAVAERKLGRSCLRRNGKNLFLDELDPKSGRDQKIIMPECGNFCDIEFADMEHPMLENVYKDPIQLRLFFESTDISGDTYGIQTTEKYNGTNDEKS